MGVRGRWLLLAALVGACEASEPSTEALGSSSGEASSGEGASGEGSSGDETGTGPLEHGAVNGQCVEPGQRFLDAYTCDTVHGPSPKQPPISEAKVVHDPETLADPDYAWVQQQVLACACTCCHAEGSVGSYVWSSTFEPAWTDAADDAVLDALGFRGGPDSIGPEQNFGFSRRNSALPTTDADRLHGFITRELARRGG